MLNFEYKGNESERCREVLTDKRLIRYILKKGSNQAADELIRRYYDDLYFYLYRQVGNGNDALDLTQEVFIAALKGLSSYDDHKSSFRTWLFRIGTYKVIDARSKLKMTWLELKDAERIEEKDFDQSLYQKELLEAINQYVASFHPEIQEQGWLNILPSYLSTNFALHFESILVLFIILISLLIPSVFVRDRLLGMQNIQWSSHYGWKILWTQFASGLTASFLLITCIVGVYCTLLISHNISRMG